MKIKPTHKKILRRLRQNSRESFAEISRATSIPVSTVFDYHKKLDEQFIHKYASLIDFRKLGYGIRVMLYIKAQDQEALEEYLLKHPNVNNLFQVEKKRLGCEVFFKTLKDYYDFLETIEPFRIQKLEEHDIIEELKLEGFKEF
jgi:DNA-binding Lrp family transcriptional regulator